MKFTLGSKITTLTVFTILFFGVLSTVMVFYSVKSIVLDFRRSSLQILARNSTDEINRTIFDSELIALSIVKQPEIINYFNAYKNQDEEILKLLNRYNIGDNYPAIFLMSRSGVVLTSTDKSLMGNNYSFKDYFKKSIAGEAAIEMEIEPTTKKAGYYISVPIRDENGEIIGVVVTKMQPEVINQLVHPSELTSSGHVMLVDDYGVIIYSDKSDRTYKSLGGLNQFERDEIKSLQRYPGNEISALDYGKVYDLIKQKKGSGLVDNYDDVDKVNEVLAFNQIGKLPFYIVFEEKEEDFTSSALKVSMILSLFVLLTAFITTIIIVVLTRRFLKPLANIIKILKEAGLGKFEKKIVVDSSDELGDVANVFNEMIGRIKETRDDVEKKIHNRTKELEKFNNLMVGREIKMIELKEQVAELEKRIESSKLKSWFDKFNEASNYEESIIRDLESAFLYQVKISDMPKKEKEKIIKSINRLVKDSKRHNTIFENLANNYEK